MPRKRVPRSLPVGVAVCQMTPTWWNPPSQSRRRGSCGLADGHRALEMVPRVAGHQGDESPRMGREGGQYQGPGQDAVQAAFVGGPRSVSLVMMQAMTERGLDAAGGYDGSSAEGRAMITDGGVATCTDLRPGTRGRLLVAPVDY